METDWDRHIAEATHDHLVDAHGIDRELLGKLSEMGKRVLHIGAHESEGTAR